MAVHFDLHAPGTWDEAVALMCEYGPDAVPLAGGTDLMIRLERQQIAPRHVVSLAQIPHWNALAVSGDLTLGAGTTYRQLEKTPVLYGKHRALVEAARQVGGVQVRNVATVAGNLCNASPAADSVPPLLVMEAALTLYGPDGARTVPADKFITGPGQVASGAGELLRQIHVPALPDRTSTVFLKAGRRRAMEISIVCVAARLTMTPEGEICQTARIALGSVAPTPIRAREAEKILEGQPLTPALLQEAAKLAVEATEPISDVRASAEYRRYLTGVMVRQALEQCLVQLAEIPA
ncbi:MAG TPA: xanthine dehydrogenase family protein subunit M [Aggregatilineaceae bacterium]|jgi:carbon-monoxide dehydrogenase medium subunit|nr:xanthine dehydrogenase family protein subunit M [Aggregatilineaceae bacterium]